MREYTLNYLFNDEPRTHVFELKQPELPLHEAAMHLLQLHFGDAENGLILPPADATTFQQCWTLSLRLAASFSPSSAQPACRTIWRDLKRCMFMATASF